jgi:hypothetical protein
VERAAQLAVVGHDEDAGGTRCPGRASRLIHETQQRLVGRPSTGVPHDQPGRDASVAHAAVRRAVEDQLDSDRRRDGRPEPTDQRRLRRRTATSG